MVSFFNKSKLSFEFFSVINTLARKNLLLTEPGHEFQLMRNQDLFFVLFCRNMQGSCNAKNKRRYDFSEILFFLFVERVYSIMDLEISFS